MKKIEISLELIIENMKKNIKVMIIIFLTILLIGLTFGIFTSVRYEYSRQQLEREPFVNVEEIQRDGGYYYKSVYSINKKKEVLGWYLFYFTQVEVSADSRIKLEDIRKEVQAYNNDYCKKLLRFYTENPAEDNGLEKTKEFYIGKINDIESRLLRLEHELVNLEDQEIAKATKLEESTRINKKKLSLEENLILLNNYVEDLSVLNEHEIDANGKKLDTMIKENEERINDIVKKFNMTMAYIAENENYEIIYNRYIIDSYYDEFSFEMSLEDEKILENKKNKAIIYAKSIEMLDMKKERFFAAVTFFIMFGAMTALIVGGLLKRDKG